MTSSIWPDCLMLAVMPEDEITDAPLRRMLSTTEITLQGQSLPVALTKFPLILAFEFCRHQPSAFLCREAHKYIANAER